MGGITCNAEGFAGEKGCCRCPGGRGGERDTNDLLSCSHYPLKGLAAGRVAGAIPHSDAASQDALDGASVEGAHDGGRGSGSSEFTEEVETLLCFLGQCCSVVGPGEVLCEVLCVQCDGAGCVTADPYCLRSPGQKVQQPVSQRRVEPQLDQFMNELLRDDCVEC